MKILNKQENKENCVHEKEIFYHNDVNAKLDKQEMVVKGGTVSIKTKIK